MVSYSSKQYAQMLSESLSGIGGGLFSLRARNFFEHLLRRRAWKLLPRILEHLERIERERQGQRLVAVTSALALEAEERRQLSSVCGAGQIQEQVDPALIAGVIVVRDDIRLDGSVRGRLRKLGAALRQGVPVL